MEKGQEVALGVPASIKHEIKSRCVTVYDAVQYHPANMVAQCGSVLVPVSSPASVSW